MFFEIQSRSPTRDIVGFIFSSGCVPTTPVGFNVSHEGLVLLKIRAKVSEIQSAKYLKAVAISELVDAPWLTLQCLKTLLQM